MSNKWKDNPELWQQIYDGNTTYKVGDLFDKFSEVRAEVRVEPQEKPREFQGLRSMVEDFWAQALVQNSKLKNDSKYGITGLQDVEVDKGVLVVRPFVTDYAHVRFKNSRPEEFNQRLTPEQIKALDELLILGVHGYVEFNWEDPNIPGIVGQLLHSYLLGERADKGPRAGLLETVPQGLIDPNKDGPSGNIFEKALARELEEETGLKIGSDIWYKRLTHINVGPKYGDFTLVSRLCIKDESRQKYKNNPEEHTKLEWKEKADILKLPRNLVNPVTVRLLEKLGQI